MGKIDSSSNKLALVNSELTADTGPPARLDGGGGGCGKVIQVKRISSIAHSKKLLRKYYFKSKRQKLRRPVPIVVSGGQSVDVLLNKSMNTGCSRLLLMMRNICDIKRMEKENFDRLKILAGRIIRKFSHLYSPVELHRLQSLVLTMTAQSTAVYVKAQTMAETAKHIIYHELIARKYMQRDGGGSRNCNVTWKSNKIDELKKCFTSKLMLELSALQHKRVCNKRI